MSILLIIVLIAITIPILCIIFIKIMPKSKSKHEKFELTSHPCISTQLKLLNRVTELLESYPNNVGLLQYHWELYHNNLTSAELLTIIKSLPR